MTASLRLRACCFSCWQQSAPRGATPAKQPPTGNDDAAEVTAPADKETKQDKSSVAETVTFLLKGQKQTVRGRTVVEAADGGILFEGVDGVLWSIERNELQGREKLDTPFKPLTPAELSEQLLAELPAGFRSYTTPHYVVCYNTSRAYAQWTGSLLERLYKAFTNYWQHQGFEIARARVPAAASSCSPIASRTTRPAAKTCPPAPATSSASTACGRTASTCSTSRAAKPSEAKRRRRNRRGSMREINQMLSQPAATPLVATVVHEATHQIAFNCGMQTRFADIPLWLCEGMAVYFEAPDLASRSGWQGIGRVNYPRLEKFRTNLGSWHDGSLEEMLRDSKRFRDPHTAVDAYADAWALNYYLIKYQPKAYTAYLKDLAEKRPLIDDDPQAAPRRIPQTLRRPAQARAGLPEADVASEVTAESGRMGEGETRTETRYDFRFSPPLPLPLLPQTAPCARPTRWVEYSVCHQAPLASTRYTSQRPF